jgi:hypothetical protein
MYVPKIEDLTQEDITSLYELAMTNKTKYENLSNIYKNLIKSFKKLSQIYLNDSTLLKLNGISDDHEIETVINMLKSTNKKINVKQYEKILSIEFPKAIMEQDINEDDVDLKFSVVKDNELYKLVYYHNYNKNKAFEMANIKLENEIYSNVCNFDELNDKLAELERENIIKRISSIKYKIFDETKFCEKI